MRNQDIRNIAIIAHVDHGKTTLVDKLLREGGAFRVNQAVAERAMDSMDLEKEKGITIRAKNTGVHWNGKTINIVDTPGHADFGGEVERVLKMVDGVLLLVDAYDGPQAQTRFVLRKALSHGLKPIVVINKIDRENADPKGAHDKVLELFLELNATDEQFNCPFIYASGRTGFAVRHLTDERKNLVPLFETILEHIPGPLADLSGPFKMLVSNVGWDDYVGRIAIGRILSGRAEVGASIFCLHKEGKKSRAKISKVFEYSGLTQSESTSGVAGNIVGIAGFEEIDIGETLTAEENGERIPFVDIDPPTIEMFIRVNDGPLAGREGKLVTSRQIRERLYREVRTNISIKVEDTNEAGAFRLSARGAMQIAVLVETMRREGYEVLVSRPEVIYQYENGQKLEPYETLWVEVPDDTLGAVQQNLANRKARITDMQKHPTGWTVEAKVTTRGLIGFETFLVNTSSGRAVMSHLFDTYGPYAGELLTRITGTLVSMDEGESTAYTLESLQERGKLFVKPGDIVYEGMIVGENPRQEDIPVNPTKAKKLSNVRSSGEGVGVVLAPPITMTLEQAIEYIEPDEYVETTPQSIRLRKKMLKAVDRKRAERAG